MENSLPSQKVEFKISEIRSLKFWIDNRPDAIRDINTEGYKFEIKVTAFFDTAIKVVGFDIEAAISTNDDKAIPVSHIVQRTGYTIKQFDKAVKISGNKMDMDSQLIKHFLSVAISTTRGVLAEKCSGTILNNVYMPPINVDQIIKQANPL